MSNRAANLTLVDTLTDTRPRRNATVLPGHLILWGALVFCLSVWGAVILAVTHIA